MRCPLILCAFTGSYIPELLLIGHLGSLLLQTIIQTHNRTWADCHQLLMYLFNMDKRQRVLQAASKWLEEHVPADYQNPQEYVRVQLWGTEPQWDPNTLEGMQTLIQYREVLLEGLKKGAQKATNINKFKGKRNPGIEARLNCPQRAYGPDDSPITPISKETTNIVGATGVSEKQSFCLPRTCLVGGNEVIHQFLLPPTLFGRDLLSKLRATTITFTGKGSLCLKLPPAGIIMTLIIPGEEGWTLFLTKPGWKLTPCSSQAMATRLTINQAHVLIKVKPGVQPVRQKEYPVPPEALKCIQVHLKRLKDYGIIVPHQSPWGIPPLACS
ncbi:Gag-Pol polyprotein [Plecturocebus cupreus]